MSAIPTLETARLQLRPHTIDDFEDFAALWADPIVTRYISGRAFTREESWSRLLRQSGHWSLLGFGFWVVQEKISGAFLGEVGYLDLHRDIDPPIQSPEIGWGLLPKFHGQGFATEAVQAALAWQPAWQPVCLIHPENLPSLRVAEKCGFHETHRTTYHGHPTIHLARAGS